MSLNIFRGFMLLLALFVTCGVTFAVDDFEIGRNLSFTPDGTYGINNASHIELNGTTITDWSQINSSGSGSGSADGFWSISGSTYLYNDSGVLAVNTTATDASLPANTSDYWDGLDSPSDLSGLGDSQISSLSWLRLNNYPSACAANQTITTLADTITCTAISLVSGQITDFSSAVIAAVQAQWSNLDTDSTDDVNSFNWGTNVITTSIGDGESITVRGGNDINVSLSGNEVTINSEVVDTFNTTEEMIAAANSTGYLIDWVANILSTYPNLDTDSTDDFDGDFGSLSNVPAGLADGDDDTQLSEGQVEAFIFDGDNTGNLTTSGNVSADNLFGSLDCSQITGGSDGDYCADASGGGGSYDLNVSGDSGTGTIADSEVFAVEGSGTVSTSVSGNTVTITGSAHTTDTNETTRVDAITADCGSGFVLQNITDSGLECVAEVVDTNTQLSEEQVEDFVGGMLGGTETLITVTYQDATGDIDFVVTDTLSSFTNDAGFITTDTDTVWSIAAPYLYNNSGTLTFNETALNATIDARDTDTNANTICSGTTTYLDGEGNCDDISSVYQAAGSYYSVGGTDVALADGGTGNSLSDPNADRILFWDDSAGVMTWLTPSTGLTVSTTSLTVRAASTSQTGIAEAATGAEVVTGTDTLRYVSPSTTGSISKVGTIASGTWQGTAIADAYISSAATWNAKIASLLADTTPQLGGELDTNGNNINMNVSGATNVTGVDCIVFNNGGQWCSG